MILGLIQSAGEESPLYSVPSDKSCIIDELIVCNPTDSHHSFSIRIAIGNEQKETKQYICSHHSICPYSSVYLGKDTRLSANDIIYIEDLSNALSFSVYGSETDGTGNILAQSLADNQSGTILYQVPDADINISKIIVCNTNSNSDLNFSIRVVPYGSDPNAKQYLHANQPIAPSQTIELSGLNIGLNDSIYVEDDNKEIAYSCYGYYQTPSSVVVSGPVYSDLIFTVSYGSNAYSITMLHKTGAFSALTDVAFILISPPPIYIYLGIDVNFATDIILSSVYFDKSINAIISCSTNYGSTSLEISILDYHLQPTGTAGNGIFWLRRIS